MSHLVSLLQASGEKGQSQVGRKGRREGTGGRRREEKKEKERKKEREGVERKASQEWE